MHIWTTKIEIDNSFIIVFWLFFLKKIKIKLLSSKSKPNLPRFWSIFYIWNSSPLIEPKPCKFNLLRKLVVQHGIKV